MVNTTVAIHTLQPDDCRQALSSFWAEQLAIEQDHASLVVALPLMLPDGVQIVVEIQPISERRAILTDAGDVLRWLHARGINLKADTHQKWIDERLAFYELSRDGFAILREIPLPIQGSDLHLFGEALVSIAHLICRHETQQAIVATADEAIVRIFTDAKRTFRTNAALPGHIEESIQVDYYFDHSLPSALQVIHRSGRILDTMERWGYRWLDLKKKNPTLRSAMIYDSARQTIDPTSQRIGEEVCDLFCAYHETDRIWDYINA